MTAHVSYPRGVTYVLVRRFSQYWTPYALTDIGPYMVSYGISQHIVAIMASTITVCGYMRTNSTQCDGRGRVSVNPHVVFALADDDVHMRLRHPRFPHCVITIARSMRRAAGVGTCAAVDPSRPNSFAVRWRRLRNLICIIAK